MTDNRHIIDLNSEALIFYHVALLHGFRAAASHLALSKSVVSSKIASLETRVGRKLLYRSTRDVSLTVEGQRYFEICQQLFQATQTLAQVKEEFQSGLSGLFTISAPHDFMVLKLVPMLRKLQALHPKLKVNLVSSDNVLNLEKNKVDLAIRVGAEGASHLFRTNFFDVDFGFFCKAGLVKKRNAEETLEWLRQEGVFVFRPARERSFMLNGREEDVRVQTQFQVNDVLSLKSLILDGAGVGILPTFAIEKEIASGELVRVLPTAEIRGVKYIFLSGTRRQDDERLSTVVEFLRNQIQQTRRE